MHKSTRINHNRSEQKMKSPLKFSREMLLFFARISELTYLNPDDAKPRFDEMGLNIEAFYNIKGAQAYIVSNNTSYVLSFRGTEISEKTDILADLKAGKNKAEAGGKVHSGFHSELNKIWGLISADLANKFADKRLFITGHSLGAGMATIATSRLLQTAKYWGTAVDASKLTLVTFGSPRVGNKTFVKQIDASNIVDHYRVQNCNDVVTKVPTVFIGYRHCGEHIYLNYNGNIKNFSTWQIIKDNFRARNRAWRKMQFFAGLYDHMISEYIQKLQQDTE
tara:strand:+ start:1309 stop:2145 length:837 start_codon:yes stop_codon:yes gene_type:complete